MVSDTVNAVQPVEHLDLDAVFEQAVRVVLGKTCGLLPVQLGSELQDRFAARDNGLRCPLVTLDQCPQRGMR